jgi:hypothetical protein
LNTASRATTNPAIDQADADQAFSTDTHLAQQVSQLIRAAWSSK